MNEIEKNIPNALIAWYDFREDSRVLFVRGDEVCDGLGEYLRQKNITVRIASEHEIVDGVENEHVMSRQPGELSDSKSIVSDLPENGKYDYIVAAGIIERSAAPGVLLKKLYTLLKSDGIFLVGTENRLGIRYFCGDKDPFSNRVADGLDNYIQVNASQREKMTGRAYSRSELEQMLRTAGYSCVKCYSVMPELQRPQMLLAAGRTPNEPLVERIKPQYNSPNTIYVDESHIYDSLMENGMFHQMSNAFLFECSKNGMVSACDQVVLQSDRGKEEALATLVTKKREVRKRPLYLQGRAKISELMEKQQYLTEHHVPLVEARVEDGSYVMPYIDGQIATEYFQELLKKDKYLFIEELESFFRIILESSEHVPYDEVNWEQFEPYWEERKKDDPNLEKWRKLAFGTDDDRKNLGVILRRGYFDLVSLNCFHTSEGYVFFDQEFYVENYPADVILVRTIDFIYNDRKDLEYIYPQDELLKHFSLYEYRETWRKKSYEFLEKLLNEKELSVYHRMHRKNWTTMASNRNRMNYPQEEFERLFTNIFKDIADKKIYLFGSGLYAEQFLEQYGKYVSVSGILDNNENRWGQNLNGFPIMAPSVLEKQDTPCKVFICIKYFDGVTEQLRQMGIKDYSVYNPSVDYDRPVALPVTSGGVGTAVENVVKKPYHIGYVAGVFDLFHIGHLNLLRRAKEQCDYLIVGVVSDEQVINSKKTSPYIPFAERFEIVRACRYVDEAVEIPVKRADTESAWHMYHFDVQFSGSDYEDDPIWAGKKAFLQQHGADMVFFPYTKGTSSTKLKEAIGEKTAADAKSILRD